MIAKTILSILRGINRNVSKVRWKNLRSTEPLSDIFGYDRGSQSIHRYYIDKFIALHQDKITGNVLEVGESLYTDRFSSGVIQHAVIHYNEIKGKNYFIGDLTKIETLPREKFDCFICTQTFNFIYDFKAAIRGSHYLLKENGFLIATVSGIQQISSYDASRWGDYWRFSRQSCVKMFSEVFGADNINVVCYGNVLSSVAALEGMTSMELTHDELDFSDSKYELIIGIVAIKK